MTKLIPGFAQGHELSQESPKFRATAQEILTEVNSNRALLGKMAYNPDGWTALENELQAKFDRLTDLEDQLTALDNGDEAQSASGQDLHQALVDEIRQQKDLLAAKFNFLQDVMNADPLSKRNVAYSNLLWAHAAAHRFRRGDRAHHGELAARCAGSEDRRTATGEARLHRHAEHQPR